MRKPIYAGYFYANSKKELLAELNLLFQTEVQYFNNALGIIVPHAGYMYSGLVAAKTYKAISSIKKKRFVILGVDHQGVNAISTSKQNWLTPLGEVKVDIDFINKITKEQAIVVDEIAIGREHSIEVQLPFLQYLFEDFKFVPIQLPNISYKEILNLAELLKDKDTFYIASSDLTHYGINYRFIPRESIYDPISYVENLDQKIINKIQEYNPKEFLDFISEYDLTVCGVIPIALLLEITKRLGGKKVEKIAYDTSFSISKDNSNIVGYCGLLIC